MLPKNVMQQFIGYCRKGDVSGAENLRRIYPTLDVDASDPITKDGMNGLMRACQSNKLDMAVFLTRTAGADVNAVHPGTGNTALLFAAEKNQHAIVEYLLSAGANVHHMNHEGKTALRIAEEKGINGPETVRVLRNYLSSTSVSSSAASATTRSATVSQKSTLSSVVSTVSSRASMQEEASASMSLFEQVKTSRIQPANVMATFVKAARIGDVEGLRTHLNLYSIDVNDRDPDGYTALMRACQGNKLEAAKYLVETAHAKVNLVHAATGNTALLFAVERGHDRVVEYLLTVGADADHLNYEGKTALVIAEERGLNGLQSRSVLKMFSLTGGDDVIHGKYATKESIAEDRSHWTLVQLVTGQGPPQKKMNTGSSVVPVRLAFSNKMANFVKAARTGDMEGLRTLLDAYSIDVNDRDPDGYTALMRACQGNKLDVAEYLVNTTAAKVDLVHEATGNTALLFAAERGHHRIVEYLLTLGANVHHRNNEGLNIAQIAQARGLNGVATLELVTAAMISQPSSKSMNVVSSLSEKSSPSLECPRYCAAVESVDEELHTIVTKQILPALVSGRFMVLTDALAMVEDEETAQAMVGIRNKNGQCILDMLYSKGELALVQKCLDSCGPSMKYLSKKAKEEYLQLSLQAVNNNMAEYWQNELSRVSS